MNIKFKQIAHLYLGCRVFVFPPESVTDGFLKKYRQNHPDGVFDPEFSLENFQRFLKDGFYPILRPVSDMKEEERAELWFLIFRREFPKSGQVSFFDKATTSADPRWVMMSGVDRLGIELNGTVWADADLHAFKHNQHQVTLFLLSKGFDLFGLIGSGQAIDKTQIDLTK